MKIYSITQDDKYKTLIDADQVESLQEFATKLAYGEVILESERQAFCVVYNSDDKNKPALSDFFTFFRPILVVSEKAYDALDFLQTFPRVKLLGPRAGDVAIFIAELLSNAFDIDQSDYDRGEGGYVVYKAVLKIPESYTGEIFRIPENPQVLYVSQVFKDAVESLGLRGLAFKEVARSY
ncbi:double-CXXCG motif protein [Pseudomonas sp. PDM28]|jgi:hypothetical protein|uniref:double-CXXCG motif protein n=1 Tax=Pseudomonas sp. PDM28 TaxID=2854770 RepID=UPI001C45BCB7|nr:double-CXXCG motif protein [Pseudomonas sp. PDM28]MBV7556143.1 double-CXXCG motif protein [Pseudomonas sp. PDM28]